MRRVRAWQVKAGDVLIQPRLNWDALKYAKPWRPIDADEYLTVTRVHGRWISPRISVRTDNSYGVSSGWGPLDWVMVK